MCCWLRPRENIRRSRRRNLDGDVSEGARCFSGRSATACRSKALLYPGPSTSRIVAGRHGSSSHAHGPVAKSRALASRRWDDHQGPWEEDGTASALRSSRLQSNSSSCIILLLPMKVTKPSASPAGFPARGPCIIGRRMILCLCPTTRCLLWLKLLLFLLWWRWLSPSQQFTVQPGAFIGATILTSSSCLS
ncbi:hypothetical protein SEVIR_3G346150v4 [Setaria viridis]